MVSSSLTEKAKVYLDILCNQIPNRRVGSKGNRLATSFFTSTIKSFGFDVSCPEFECMDWRSEGATISIASESFDIQASPYSLGIQVKAPLVVACSLHELEMLDISNKIVLMRGELAKEQLIPKKFPFFQVEDHQRIIHLLEAKKPQAIITATTDNPEMAAALYPFPVLEDGDFDIPSAYMTGEQGAQLARHEGKEASLAVRATRIPARACNVVARKGHNCKARIVLFAHMDAKVGTPGALDNGTGIVTLLLVAELLKDYRSRRCVEIIALNGEDYYSNPGEQWYLLENEGRFYEIDLGINIDGLGYIRGKTAYSLYECPPEIRDVIEQVFTSDDSFLAGEPWFQGDHALFLMKGRPALALTSECVHEIMTRFIHTDRDTPEIVDPDKIVRTALALYKLITKL